MSFALPLNQKKTPLLAGLTMLNAFF